MKGKVLNESCNSQPSGLNLALICCAKIFNKRLPKWAQTNSSGNRRSIFASINTPFSHFELVECWFQLDYYVWTCLHSNGVCKLKQNLKQHFEQEMPFNFSCVWTMLSSFRSLNTNLFLILLILFYLLLIFIFEAQHFTPKLPI